MKNLRLIKNFKTKLPSSLSETWNLDSANGVKKSQNTTVITKSKIARNKATTKYLYKKFLIKINF